MLSAPDFMPVDRLRAIQNRKFLGVFRRTYENVPWYRELLAKNNVDPNSIQSLADISKLPFIKKTDLRDTYPNGMLATAMDKIVRYHASSGTTGKPIVVPYTREDLDVWSECVSRCLTAYGLDESDVLQVGYGYGLFTGGLGLHDGGTRRGCTVIPISGGNTERHLMLIQDLQVTAVACTPSYFLHVIDLADKVGYDEIARRYFRRRAVDGRDAPFHRGEDRHSRVRYLRSDGNLRAWRRRRMLVPHRRSHL